MLRFLRPAGALTATLALLLVAGCGGSNAGGTDTQPGQLDVVVAFYPFEFIAERVAGSHANVTDLTAPGAEPHDLELTPRQVAAVSDADLLVYEKGFQAAVDKAVSDTGTQNAFDTTTVVALQPFDTEHSHTDGDDDDHATDHTAEEGSAEAAGLDPHVWLDPKNMITITQGVADQLSKADPEHAAEYATNAKSLVADLTALDSSFRTGLASCERTEFITTHAAFGYLAGDYGLEQIGISGLDPETEPSASRIAEVQAEAGEHGVTTIFYETLVSPAVATSIADDLGLKTDVLDPLEGITDQSKGNDYIAVMSANLASLQAANGCR